MEHSLSTHDFLAALAIVLVEAALVTVLFHRLRQPVVLGYLIAGVLAGPHVLTRITADPASVRALSEVGVILLMFCIGLEFHVRKLARIASTAGMIALIQCSLMLWLGFVGARAAGWTMSEAILTGSIVAISSTTIVAKVFEEHPVSERLRELVLGILIAEDLIAVLLIAVVTTLGSGGPGPAELIQTSLRMLAFVCLLLAVGMLVVPRTVRMVNRIGRTETTVVASAGICFAIALLAEALGYSVALGAFLAGTLVAESGEARRVERAIHPVRDVFAAIFFVSVGMLIDPAEIARHWQVVLALTLLVVVGKIAGVSLGAILTGSGVRTSVQAGMSLAQIGEFAFILAGLGLAMGGRAPMLYSVAVAVSALTTLATPWLIRASGPAASQLDRVLPHRLQTMAALYGSWLARVRRARPRGSRGADFRRLLGMLALDAGLLATLLIGSSLSLEQAADIISRLTGLTDRAAKGAAVAATTALCVPLCLGIARVARRLAEQLADHGFPRAVPGTPDLAAAPRRALAILLQLAIVLLVGAPLAALTQPFLPGPVASLPWVLILGALAFTSWRRAEELEGHVEAGALAVAAALGSQSRAETTEPLQALFYGLGDPVAIALEPGCAGVGSTLSGLDLRGVTGATVLAISRGPGDTAAPDPHEPLRAGDVLAVAGTPEAVAAARALLTRSMDDAEPS